VTGGKRGRAAGLDGAALAYLNESQTTDKMQGECQGRKGDGLLLPFLAKGGIWEWGAIHPIFSIISPCHLEAS
jgi:hypothetical protein